MTYLQSWRNTFLSPPLTIRQQNSLAWLVLLGWLIGLLLFCYGAALALPFMADDFFHFPFVDGHTFAEIWQTAEGLYYFRPVAFAYWKVAQTFTGAHNPWLLHATNLFVHLVNALLVGWLADRLWPTAPVPAAPNWTRRFLAATLFIVYPFSYEAVPWVGALMHPQVVTLVLIGTIGYLHWRDRRSIVWGLASLLAALLAPFTHENGALLFPLLAAVEITRPQDVQETWGQRIKRLSLWLIPLLIWYLIWRHEPQTVGTGGLRINRLSTMLRNATYILQAAAYPVTWFAAPLLRLLPVNELVGTAVLSVTTLAGAAWIQWRAAARRPSLLPWLWIPIASLPALVFLSYSYLQAAPRVLMLAAVGIVWLWVDVICLLPALFRRTSRLFPLPRLLSAGLFCLILLQSILYIRQQMRTYDAGGALIWDIVEKTTTANAAGQVAVFANLPTWLALPRTYFALGEEGAMLMPTADKMDTLVTTHTNQPARIVAIEHAATRQEMPYYHGLINVVPDWDELAGNRAQVFTTRYAADTLFAEPAGSIQQAPPGDPAATLATFGECLALQAAEAVPGAEALEIVLTWRNVCAAAPQVTVFVHVLGDDGRLLAQADGDPLAGILPFAQWPVGSLVQDRRFVPLDAPPTTILIGLYDRAGGTRVPAYDAAGEPWRDDAVAVPVR